MKDNVLSFISTILLGSCVFLFLLFLYSQRTVIQELNGQGYKVLETGYYMGEVECDGTAVAFVAEKDSMVTWGYACADGDNVRIFRPHGDQ